MWNFIMDYGLLLFGGSVAALGLGFTAAVIYSEAYEWNKGRCLRHGREWIRFDYDNSGRRGYKCSDTEHGFCVTWIGWWSDKNYDPFK